MKTKVFITIDTEFSIGGAFADPVNNRPVGMQAVMCDIAGKSHGLGFMLDTFALYGVPATFFVEVLNVHFFGDQPMRELALRIRAAGHDVQLHMHPVWTYFKNPEWKSTLKSHPPSDHMNGRTLGQISAWLDDGISTFERWGLARPIALRAGSLMVDMTVYRAMELAAIPVGSNVGLAVFWPEDPALRFFSGIHRLGGVLEVCITTYSDFSLGSRRHYKTLTITGSSWPETRAILERAHLAGVESIVVLTHPFEYVKYKNADFSGLHPNRINQERLSQLCAFLRDHPAKYQVATMADLAATAAGTAMPPSGNEVISVPSVRAIERIAQNALNDRIAVL